ncbi:hypothetical protein [Serratia fonticola]|uniref:Hypervirulence associated protein TUDOR domain-containing protein n=1 Tax=Serratia fonticola TaxID=47917 RepID=A0ABY9PMK9_SERFO|nr:hypothetical protein [Serratia fonticola]WMT13381.1 hypothetical protein RFB13_19385 [Serratia fonticola]
MVKVGDKVTTKFRPHDWGTVTKVGGLPEHPNVDIQYPDGTLETGVPSAAIDEHAPIDQKNLQTKFL